MSVLSVSAQPGEEELRPTVVVRERDHDTLCAIAIEAMLRAPRLAGGLLDELQRAQVRPDREVPDDVAGIGSVVTYHDDTFDVSWSRRVELVTPLDEHAQEGRISVLSNLGAALVGLRSGDAILWHDRLGGASRLTIKDVSPPRGPGEARP